MVLQQMRDCARAQLAMGVSAYALGLDPAEMIRQLPGVRKACSVRQLAMYLTYTAFEMSLSRCAYAFNRDRSTIAHACRAIEDRRDDAAFDQWVDGLEAGLKVFASYAPNGREVL